VRAGRRENRRLHVPWVMPVFNPVLMRMTFRSHCYSPRLSCFSLVSTTIQGAIFSPFVQYINMSAWEFLSFTPCLLSFKFVCFLRRDMIQLVLFGSSPQALPYPFSLFLFFYHHSKSDSRTRHFLILLVSFFFIRP
jgi:hypothetical protein